MATRRMPREPTLSAPEEAGEHRALAWAALVWLSVLGIVLFLMVAGAERLLMPWAGTGHR